MKNLAHLLSEYGESHQNETNKTIHWICVPAIFFSIIGLLYSIKLPWQAGNYPLNVAVLMIFPVIIYYVFLSRTIWIGMFIFCITCLLICDSIEDSGIIDLWLCSLIIFILAWIGQFYGHKVEGKKPSFLKDLQFLLIGPAWLMGFIYEKLGVSY
ncbi:MAG: DUF962 domain-containing protein [Ferruginibacter sp.]